VRHSDTKISASLTVSRGDTRCTLSGDLVALEQDIAGRWLDRRVQRRISALAKRAPLRRRPKAPASRKPLELRTPAGAWRVQVGRPLPSPKRLDQLSLAAA